VFLEKFLNIFKQYFGTNSVFGCRALSTLKFVKVALNLPNMSPNSQF
jgi:hypothetical protein